jgi:hypothetical protein
MLVLNQGELGTLRFDEANIHRDLSLRCFQPLGYLTLSPSFDIQKSLSANL